MLKIKSMDAEKRLLLLHLKSDLQEILKLTRVKSEELISSFHNKSDKTIDMAEDLEYYISSLLDITREMKKVFDQDVPVVELKPQHIDVNSTEFESLLTNLSNSEDAGSLKEILNVLENWEFYELCAKVNDQIKAVSSKAS